MGGISSDAEYRVAVNKLRESVGAGNSAATNRWRRAVRSYERRAENEGREISNPGAVRNGRR